MAIFTFDLTDHGDHIKISQFNLVKKLLYVLQKLERSSGFVEFNSRIGKT